MKWEILISFRNLLHQSGKLLPGGAVRFRIVNMRKQINIIINCEKNDSMNRTGRYRINNNENKKKAYIWM